MELGMQVPFRPGDEAAQAQRVESDGFDVGLFGDSQHMVGDPYARMVRHATVILRGNADLTSVDGMASMEGGMTRMCWRDSIALCSTDRNRS